jgi:putative nucleotidyltransferase with HDIG domain
MNEKLDRYIEGVKDLPMAPTVLVRLIALFQQPDRDVDGIVELMRQDPSLTAEVLRHSNSAYFGQEEPIVDVFEAVTRVGFYEVYKTAVAKLGSQALQRRGDAGGPDVEKLWRHSATAAAAAGVIARKAQENEGLAFTAGLLHDLGKIVLSAAESGGYALLTKQFENGGLALQRAEAMLYGFGHAEVGGHLLSRWGLPDNITEPVRRHHQLEWAEPFERICAVVSLGNIVAHGEEDAIPAGQYESQEALGAMRVLRLEADDMASLLEDARNDIRRMAGLLGVEAK